MIGYILTETQKDLIQGQFYSEWQVFSCALDINDVWFIILTSQDEVEVAKSQYSWILALPKGEYVPKPIVGF
jgi:hypothetical protein